MKSLFLCTEVPGYLRHIQDIKVRTVPWNWKRGDSERRGGGLITMVNGSDAITLYFADIFSCFTVQNKYKAFQN